MSESRTWGMTLPAPFAARALQTLFVAGWTCTMNRLYTDMEILGALGSTVMYMVNVFLVAAIFLAIWSVAASGLVISADSKRARACSKVIGLLWLAMLTANITFISVATHKCNAKPFAAGDMQFCKLFSSAENWEAAGGRPPWTALVAVFYVWITLMAVFYLHEFTCWMLWEKQLKALYKPRQSPMQESDLERWSAF